MNESSAERSEKVKAEIDKLKKRNTELDQMYIRLYEDYSSGKLSEKKFTMMSAHYEQEQDANEEKLPELERQHIHETLLFRKNFSSFQTVVRARAYAGSLKSKAILKELNCPAESNVILNFCQLVNYRKLPPFCRKFHKNYSPIKNSM